MPCDLRVAGIKLPNGIVGACPTDIDVDVVNAGPDPASFPFPMTVCLDISSSLEDRALAHFSVEIPRESPSIPPKAIRTFHFSDVQFPCVPKAWVTATADCAASVPNNLRTDPKLSVFVPKIGAMPWLWTDDLRVGLKDSTGRITWDPGGLCGGASCVVEVQIRNAGCAAAAASVTALDLVAASGQSIASLTQNTAPIAAGVTSIVTFTLTLPAAVSGKQITFRACADSTGAVTPQCNLQHACAERTLVLASVGGPKVSLTVNASIFPGCPLPISWRIQNFCADIGQATARITFQGNVLYTSVAIPVGLQDAEKGEDLTVVPTPSVASSFYKSGTRSLGLEIVGTGTDPGPYKSTAAMTVMLEPVPSTWAFTAPPPGTTAGFPWKAPYTVAGRLSDPASVCATMVPSSVVLNEVSTVLPAAVRSAVPPLGPIVPGGFGSAAWFGIIQSWSWLVPGTWIITGPLSGTFTYTVTFGVADIFGNAYPPLTSTPTVVVISVSGLKIGLAIAALVAFVASVALLVSAFLALAGVITAVAAGPLFAAAAGAFALAGGLGAGALDPPVPDFDYGQVAPVARIELPVLSGTAVRPLVPLLALLSRIVAAFGALTTAEARLMAARIDRDIAAVARQAAAYAEARESLLAAARAIPLAAHEATEAARMDPALRPLTQNRELQRAFAAWSRRGFPAKLHRAWAASGLPPEQLREIEAAARTPGVVMRPLEPLMRELTQAAGQIAAGIEEASEELMRPRTSVGSTDRAPVARDAT